MKVLDIFFDYLYFSFMILMFCFLFYAIHLEEKEHINNRVWYEFELLSVENNSQIYGSFFLISGSIEGREYYFAYIKRKDSSIFRAKIPVENVLIYEGYPIPVLKYYSAHSEEDIVMYLSGQSDSKLIPRGIKIYIPENSIRRELNL